MTTQDAFHWQIYRDMQSVPPAVTMFLTHTDHGSVYQSPPWVVATHPKPDRFVVMTATKDRQPVFAALVEKSRLPGTRYAYGYVHRGPVFDDIEHAIALWPEFDRLMKAEGVIAAMVQPFWERRTLSPLISYLTASGYTASPKNRAHADTLVIDLSQSTDDIFKNSFSSMRRGRIRKAVKMGIHVTPAGNETDLRTFWDMYRQMCLQKKIRFWSFDKFRRVYRYSRRYPSNCMCLIARLQDEIIGGLILLRHAQMVEFTKGGSTPKPMRGVPKTELLHWEAIQRAKQSGAKIYDFGGYTPNAIQGSAEWGINQFKKAFTRQRMRLCRPMEKILNPIPFECFNLLQKAKQTVYSRIPTVQKVLS